MKADCQELLQRSGCQGMMALSRRVARQEGRTGSIQVFKAKPIGFVVD